MRGPDGKTFYMVLTDMSSSVSWNTNRAMVLLKSTDLINWEHSIIDLSKRYPGQENLTRVWTPQTIYDPEADKLMIYWAMQYGDGPDAIYYAYANEEFTDLEGEPQPLFIPDDNSSCSDGDIVYKDGLYHLFYRTKGHGQRASKWPLRRRSLRASGPNIPTTSNRPTMQSKAREYSSS